MCTVFSAITCPWKQAGWRVHWHLQSPLSPSKVGAVSCSLRPSRTTLRGPVSAEVVASLLAKHGVSVAILNACQSAMQTASEVGLAQCLAESGVPIAVGMAYSVTVTAVVRAVPLLYRLIIDGKQLDAAVHAVRRDLFEHREREVYFGQKVDLQDWVLPVMFGQHMSQIRLREMVGDETIRLRKRTAELSGEPTTEYGFLGRDLDIQSIERLLLAHRNNNGLLVQGMAGAGKSTLLTHLAWWWQRTGLVERVFRFSYEDRSWTHNQIIREIRSALLTQAEQALADTLPDAAQSEQIAQQLRAARHLLILDNTESITGSPAVVSHALNLDEQQGIKRLLAQLSGGRTLVLIGSRESELWLTSDGSGVAVYPLTGLDQQAASVLVERILNRHDVTHYLEDPPEREALEDLIALLGGYPLSLTVVLPVLAVTPPSVVLADLKAGGPGPDPAGMIHRAIEYSYDKLDPALQNSLLVLAPFISVIDTGQPLTSYQELLEEQETLRNLGPLDLSAAINQAISVGLAVPHQQLPGFIQVQPILPYFLRSRLRDRPELQLAVNQAHYQLYTRFGPALHRIIMSDNEPEQRILGLAIVQAEYANLTAALSHGLSVGQLIGPLMNPLDEYLAQTQQHSVRLQLCEDSIVAYPSPANQPQRGELSVLHDIAGRAATALHRLDDAREHFEIMVRLLQANGDRRAIAATYHQLGVVAQLQRRFEYAETSHRNALELFLELGDRYGSARSYQQLGMLALVQRRLEEAESCYRKALDIKLSLDDRRDAAITFHHLGIVEQEAGTIQGRRG